MAHVFLASPSLRFVSQIERPRSIPWRSSAECDSVFARLHPNENYVLELLQDSGLVTRSQIDSARSRLNGAPTVVDVLVRDGIVSETEISRTLAAQAHMDWGDLSTIAIPPEVISPIRAEDARRFKVIPVGIGDSGLVVAISDPLDV